MSFIIAKDIHTHIQCRKIIANYWKIMQMTNASTKAVASLTPCLRPSSFGAPAKRPCRVDGMRFARQSAHCGVIFARRRESEWSAQGDPNSHVIRRSVPLARASS